MEGTYHTKIIMRWENGREVEIGSIDIASENKGTQLTSRTHVSGTRFGWEIVRLGFRIMFPGRKWLEKHD